jgi:hypothetical protein
MFKGMSNKKSPTTIKKAQQKLIKEKRDIASTATNVVVQRQRMYHVPL